MAWAWGGWVGEKPGPYWGVPGVWGGFYSGPVVGHQCAALSGTLLITSAMEAIRS